MKIFIQGANERLEVHEIPFVASFGSQGPQGPQGPQGIQGEPGPQGIQGIEGPVGPDAFVWQGEWASGMAYAQRSAVRYSGTINKGVYVASTDIPASSLNPESDIRWNFVISDGQRGEQGVQGIQGIQGIQGEPGQPGTNGQDGNSADVVEYPTDRAAQEYSDANPLAIVISTEGFV